MWTAYVLPVLIWIAFVSTQSWNGTLHQNGTTSNTTNVTHVVHHHHHHHHHVMNVTNVTSQMPYDNLPPLATAGTDSPIHGGIPLYKHPHYDESGKVLWFPRILGGTPATVGEFPSKVSLQTSSNSAHICGGTLLTMRHVLTAAHCVTDIRGTPMSVSRIQAMADDLNVLPTMRSPTRQTRPAHSLVIHEKYDPSKLTNDLAIVRLASEFSKTSTLYPAKRVSSSPQAGQLCSLSGWGVTSEHSQNISPTLQRVNLEVLTFDHCNTAYKGTLTSGMLCAWGPGRDACQGDSGGALMCHNQVAGVVSFGAGCAHPGFPGVYMDVAYFEKWIKKAINGAVGVVPNVWCILMLIVIVFRMIV
ncbi:trypsin beta-like [Toxorhynchites rutilus septentrionalis]|uniref:trypsin beta-like n=1 Tax=Toxorhynchites rutilus septentrionalis TaxID=329112 RepID=UPI0024798464|nr:trypsin beta-like [Toxorhynchites rutilus septentrionalis]